MRDVRERPAVHERGNALERLHEIRLERVGEQRGHRTRRAELLGRHQCAVGVRRNRDRPEAATEIRVAPRDRDDRHHLGGRGDVEAGLARHPVRAPAEPDDDTPQRAVVHVETAPPADGVRVDPQVVAVQQVRFQHGREQVVRGADCVNVAGEMQVHELRGNDLCPAAAGAAALDAEHRSQRRFAQAQRDVIAVSAECVGQRDRRRRLPFARLRRRDRRDADELSVAFVLQAVERRKPDLRGVRAVELELVGLEAELVGNVDDGTDRGACRKLHASSFSVRGNPAIGQTTEAVAGKPQARRWSESPLRGGAAGLGFEPRGRFARPAVSRPPPFDRSGTPPSTHLKRKPRQEHGRVAAPSTTDLPRPWTREQKLEREIDSRSTFEGQPRSSALQLF